MLPVAALIAPGEISPEIPLRDMPVMLALTLAIAGVAWSRKGTHEIARSDGVLLLLGFLAYQGWIVYSVLALA